MSSQQLQDPQESQESQESGMIRAMMVLMVYAIPVLSTVRAVGAPVYDPDVWWHLRVGQWILEHQQLPSIDPFSQTEVPWRAYSWLFEVVLYGLYSLFGLAGVVIYRVAMALLVTNALYRLINHFEPRFLPATLLSGATTLAVTPLFGERPWLITILFSIWTIEAILRLWQGRSFWIYLLPVVFVFWANTHIQFIYGLGMLLLACLATGLDPVLKRWQVPIQDASNAISTDLSAKDEQALLTRKRLLIMLGLCVLASLVTPYHVSIYLVVVEYATQPGPFQFINELQAPTFREWSEWVLLGLSALAVYRLGWRRERSSFLYLLLISGAFFAFRARRDEWFLALAAATILARTGLSTETRLTASDKLIWTGQLRSVFAVGLIGLISFMAWARGLTNEQMEVIVAEKFPVHAAQHIKEKGYTGPLFNDFNWGGYLIWALPEYRVALDGRTNLHGDERIERFGEVWAGVPASRGDADLNRAGIIVAPADAPLVSLLDRDDRFYLAYADIVARVYCRRK